MDRPELESALKHLVGSAPTPVARLARAALDGGGDALAGLVLWTFRLLAIQLLCEHRMRGEELTPALHRLLTRDLQRPTAATWLELLREAGRGLSPDRPPLTPELYALHGASGVPSVVGSPGPTPAEALPQLVAFADGRRASPPTSALLVLMELCRFWDRQFLWVPAEGGLRLVGCTPQRHPLASGARTPLLVDGEARLPFLGLIRWIERDLVAFGSSMGGRSTFLTWDGKLWHHPESLGMLLTHHGPMAGPTVAPHPSDLAHMRALAADATRARLRGLRRADRWRPERTVPRPEVQRAVAGFEAGTSTALLIGGGRGSGKTTALAELADASLAAGDVVVLLSAVELERCSPAERVSAVLGFPGRHLAAILHLADASFRGRRWQLRVFLDDLGAHSDPQGLLRGVDVLVRMCHEIGWCRVVVAVPAALYLHLPSGDRYHTAGPSAPLLSGGLLCPDHVVELAPLSAAQIGAVMERVAEFGDAPQTTLEMLDPGGTTARLLRNPQLLVLALRAWSGETLPDDLDRASLVAQVLARIVLPAAREDAGFGVLFGLLDAFLVRQTPAVVRDRLAAELKTALRDPTSASAYTRLVATGVVEERWTGAAWQVRFCPDLLLPYLLAWRFERRTSRPEGVRALAQRALRYPPLRTALGIRLRDACCAQDRPTVNAILVAGRIGPDHAGPLAALLSDVVLEALMELVLGPPDALEVLLSGLRGHPSPGNADALQTTFTELHWSEVGERAVLQSLSSTALGICQALVAQEVPGAPSLLARSFELQALLELPHDASQALALLDRATRAVSERPDTGLTLLRDPSSAERRSRAHQGAVRRRAEISLEAGGLRMARGELVAARVDLDRALSAARELGDQSLETSCQIELGCLARDLGQLSESRASFERVLTLAEDTDAGAERVNALLELGNLAVRCGDTGAGRRRVQRALAIAEELGDDELCSTSLLALGELYAHRGAWRQSLAFYARGVRLCEAGGLVHAQVLALSRFGMLQARLGALAEAAEVVSAAGAVARRHGSRPALLPALIAQGSVAWLHGELSAAVEHWEQALQIGVQHGGRSQRARAAHLLARAHQHRGQPDRAREILGQLQSETGALEAPYDRAGHLHRTSGLAWSAGRLEEATRLAESGFSVGQQIADVPLQARGLWRLARLAWLQGELGAGERHMSELLRIQPRSGDPVLDLIRGTTARVFLGSGPRLRGGGAPAGWTEVWMVIGEIAERDAGVKPDDAERFLAACRRHPAPGHALYQPGILQMGLTVAEALHGSGHGALAAAVAEQLASIRGARPWCRAAELDALR